MLPVGWLRKRAGRTSTSPGDPVKVFCAGMPKCGTSTLHRAFTEAGLVSRHGREDRNGEPLAIRLWRAFLEDRDPFGYLDRGIEAVTEPTLTRNKDYGLATIWPQVAPGFLRAVRAYNPDTLMLLHVRPTKDWVASIDRWKNLRARMVKADLPFLPPGVGSEDADLKAWFDGHTKRVRAMFKGDPRFLEVDITDAKAPEKIGTALDMKLPWWGVENANAKEPE